ncbi:hypothetical protein BKA62DRAFT_303426 [Auriculariales sp. MPI-PUGE-AT-0066]|nr:hypothetical protein BKA62DRAFT_303426 [Auriculariales sp. MPI-PUGE-AT-0066]
MEYLILLTFGCLCLALQYLDFCLIHHPSSLSHMCTLSLPLLDSAPTVPVSVFCVVHSLVGGSHWNCFPQHFC